MVGTDSNKGFTIVELVIVIVVIGILATLAIVIYGDTQRRAHNAKTISDASAWHRIITTYKAVNKRLPDDWTCLGQSVNEFPPTGDFGAGICEKELFVGSGWSSEYKTVSATATLTKMRNQITNLPAAGSPVYKSGSAAIRGLVYRVVSDPTQVTYPGAYIMYTLKGETCPSIDEAFRTVGDLNVCARLLTNPGPNWINEICLPENMALAECS